MSRWILVIILHVFIGSTLAGAGVIAALSLGYDTLTPILATAAAGFLGAFPVSVYVSKKIANVG